jgi:succinyl-CoA synthetase alpha subunit/malate-CoA ligase subunit alpha
VSVFVDKDSRVVIQGFTGQHATFHAEDAIAHGTNVVGGVTPGKGGSTHLGLPVFDSVAEAVAETGADVTGIFAPPQVAVDALLEAIEAGVEVAVIIADGVPVQDMVRTKRYLTGRSTTIIGPNSPGIITPGQCKVGIMPAHIYSPGRVGVVSRSGTLNYEAVSQMTNSGSAVDAWHRRPRERHRLQGRAPGLRGGRRHRRRGDDRRDRRPQEVEAALGQPAHDEAGDRFVAGVSRPAAADGCAGAVISGDSDTAQAARRDGGGPAAVRNLADIGATVARAARRAGLDGHRVAARSVGGDEQVDLLLSIRSLNSAPSLLPRSFGRSGGTDADEEPRSRAPTRAAAASR